MLNLYSTRLFPKNKGADSYDVTGIAANCDWVIFSDSQAPKTHLLNRAQSDTPKSIFLSLRSHSLALNFFVEQILPIIHSPFILISGSEDITIPNQVDRRWPRLNFREKECIETILRNPHLRHWAVENLDARIHPYMFPIPVGMVYTNTPKVRAQPIPVTPVLADRPLTVLCGHRVRNGPQWDLRKSVSAIAKHNWSEWCTILDEEIPEQDFLNFMCEHSFVLCVEGGGLDPSPKAWQALLHGAIPIIKRNALYDAYCQLPVVFVDDWEPNSISRDKLHKWRVNLIEHYDVPEKRAEVLRRLGLDYWWNQINEFTVT